MNNPVALSASHLSVGYGHKVILSDINISVRQGEMVALLGRNGGGKSTLLRTLAGLQKPLGGTFTIGDVALVLTEHDVMSRTTVHDVVAMGRYPYTSFMGGLSAEDERIISEAILAVGFPHPASREFTTLSDGEKQRVLIAKALAQQTPIILLDEPTSFLDIPSRIQVFTLLQRLAHEQSKAILISTHELDLAQRYADRLFPVDDILTVVERIEGGNL